MVNVTVVKIATGESLCLELSNDSTVEILKMLIEADQSIKMENQLLYFNSHPLNNDFLTLEEIGITEGSLVAVVDNTFQLNPSGASVPNSFPMPSQSAQGGSNRGDFTRYLTGDLEERRNIQQALLNPFSVEAQRYMEQRINRERISENLSLANEYLPESFAHVSMLYVQIEVNKVSVQAFVDSGAQATIMSKKCAEKCNLSKLIDTSYQGIAKGVGITKIVGKIHLADIKIGSVFYPASFTILEDDKVDFLLGLDLLRRYQCSIDLSKNVLRIQDNEVPFIAERDIINPLHDAF